MKSIVMRSRVPVINLFWAVSGSKLDLLLRAHWSAPESLFCPHWVHNKLNSPDHPLVVAPLPS